MNVNNRKIRRSDLLDIVDLYRRGMLTGSADGGASYRRGNVWIKNESDQTIPEGGAIRITGRLYPDAPFLNAHSQLMTRGIELRGTNSAASGSGEETESGTFAVLCQSCIPGTIVRAFVDGIFGAVVDCVNGDYPFATGGTGDHLISDGSGEFHVISSSIKKVGSDLRVCFLQYRENGGHLVGTTAEAFTQNSTRSETVDVSVGNKTVACYVPLAEENLTIPSGTVVIIGRRNTGEWDIIAGECSDETDV